MRRLTQNEIDKEYCQEYFKSFSPLCFRGSKKENITKELFQKMTKNILLKMGV